MQFSEHRQASMDGNGRTIVMSSVRVADAEGEKCLLDALFMAGAYPPDFPHIVIGDVGGVGTFRTHGWRDVTYREVV